VEELCMVEISAPLVRPRTCLPRFGSARARSPTSLGLCSLAQATRAVAGAAEHSQHVMDSVRCSPQRRGRVRERGAGRADEEARWTNGGSGCAAHRSGLLAVLVRTSQS